MFPPGDQMSNFKEKLFSKLILNPVSGIVKKSRALQDHLFRTSLGSETEDFIVHRYYRSNLHVERTLHILQRLGLTGSSYIVIEAGGGVGGFTGMIQNALNSDVYVFEPIEENFLKIESAVAGNSRVHIHKYAVGKENKRIHFHQAKVATISSRYEPSPDPSSSLFSGDIEKARILDIEMRRLDSAGLPPLPVSLLKMDIQGGELDALIGMGDLLDRTQVVLAEVLNHRHYKDAPQYFEVDSYLRSHDFTLCDLLPSTWENGILKEFDAIYLRNHQLTDLQKKL